MNKTELIDQIANGSGLTKVDARKALDATVKAIKDALVAGDSVSFIGFGTFATAERAARKARVPGTNKTIDVPASKAVKFKVGKQLKEAVAAAKKPKKK